MPGSTASPFDSPLELAPTQGLVRFGDGRRCMRVSVCNWQTPDEDVQRAIRAAARVL